MNKLPLAKRVMILSMLVEGSSMRSISRVADVSINTVTKMLVDAGEACLKLHDETVRNVTASRVQADEIWSFCYAKENNVAAAKSAPDGAGDVWTWTAIDADSKLIVSFFVGDRSGQSAIAMMDDLRSRLANRVQLTTGGHRAYLDAVEGAFGGVDYAQLIKLYGASPEGDPDLKHVSKSYVERQNLNIRMGMRRYTRLTNAFSKKIENHIYMVALYTMFYNFIRIHKTLEVSPAMAAGVSDRLWSMEDIAMAIEPAAPVKRGSYKIESGMRRTITLAAVVLFGFGLMPSAQADWQFTHWGMKSRELVTASRGEATPATSHDGANLEMPYSTGPFTFMAEFFFDSSNGLYKIQLNLIKGDPIELRDSLAEKYGDAPQSQYPVLYSIGAIWKNKTDKITFLNVPGPTLNSSVTYQWLISDGL